MALVPDALARAFLNRVRQPLFRYIVPGLSLPPAEVAGFNLLQRFAQQQRPGLQDIPPICLFHATQIGLEADVIESQSPCPDRSSLSRAPADVLSGFVSRDSYDHAE